MSERTAVGATRAPVSLVLVAVWAGVLTVGGCREQPPTDAADLVVTNGRVFTVAEGDPWAESVAAKDGRILAVGSADEVGELIGPSTRVLDVEGRLVLPGFIDAHVHFTGGGRSLLGRVLGGAGSIEEIQAEIAAAIAELPEGAPVRARASFPFPHTSLFPGLGWPTKEILDEVSPDNPVVIGGGHHVWVNSVALELSGITKDTEAPFGGEIVKDPDTGEPTGILIEAAGLLRIPRDPSRLGRREATERALEHAASLGITGIHVAGGSSSLEGIELYKELQREGKLTLRVYAALSARRVDEWIAQGIERGQGDEMVRVGFLKTFIDGTSTGRSALMFEDYSDDPGNRGMARYEEEEFHDLVEKAHANGYQIGVHSIGDRGVHWVLNAIERAQQRHGKKGLRHRVEHNMVNTVADTERFQQLGVIASMQPILVRGEQLYWERRERRLGVERARRVHMWKTLLDNGTMLAFGTDWPSSRSLNPMFNLLHLVTGPGPNAEQRLTMGEAIRYYTYGSAYASHEEQIKGSLEVGKLADMVVLSQDLFEIEPEQIPSTEVLYTILGGRIVYQKTTESTVGDGLP